MLDYKQIIEKLLNTIPRQPKVALFTLVSDEQYIKDLNAAIDKGEMNSAYIASKDGLDFSFANETDRESFLSNTVRKRPVRATKGSGGYDFFSPFAFRLKPEQSITIPTGIHCTIDPNYVLIIGPKSGKGTTYRVMMRNTLGVIDADYYSANNEGHIILKIINDNKENLDLCINAGDSIMQGIFLPYGITYDDNVTESRKGGFGSTVK